MANMIQNAKDSINALLEAACARAVEKRQLPGGASLSGTVEIPKDTQNGDYAANHAMTGARALHMAPRKIAEALVENLDLDGSWFSSVEVAGPGFINFRLAPAWYADVLSCVRAEDSDYGRVDEGHGKKLMVEFVSANPTGPMHMGNARGGVLGDALASVLDRAGYKVWREFYVNDAGNQIEKFASSIDARYQQLILGHCPQVLIEILKTHEARNTSNSNVISFRILDGSREQTGEVSLFDTAIQVNIRVIAPV